MFHEASPHSPLPPHSFALVIRVVLALEDLAAAALQDPEAVLVVRGVARHFAERISEAPARAPSRR